MYTWDRFWDRYYEPDDHVVWQYQRGTAKNITESSNDSFCVYCETNKVIRLPNVPEGTECTY